MKKALTDTGTFILARTFNQAPIAHNSCDRKGCVVGSPRVAL
jgi:hypothetical protein